MHANQVDSNSNHKYDNLATAWLSFTVEEKVAESGYILSDTTTTFVLTPSNKPILSSEEASRRGRLGWNVANDSEKDGVLAQALRPLVRHE